MTQQYFRVIFYSQNNRSVIFFQEKYHVILYFVFVYDDRYICQKLKRFQLSFRLLYCIRSCHN